jgi:hypothetical protein
MSALAPYVRRQLQEQLNRSLFEFLSLYSNRLRRWMEQTLGAMRKAFVATADLYRAQFEGVQPEDAPDVTAVESDLRALQQWESA